jgi:hypothetical protein
MSDIEMTDLLFELRSTLSHINEQLNSVYTYADSHGTEPSRLQTTTGEFMLTPLLVAKANVLSALTSLKKAAE